MYDLKYCDLQNEIKYFNEQDWDVERNLSKILKII